MEWIVVVAVLLLNINTEDHTLHLERLTVPDFNTCLAITTDKGGEVFMEAANKVFIATNSEARAIMVKGTCILVQKI